MLRSLAHPQQWSLQLPSRRRVFVWLGILAPIALLVNILWRFIAFAQLFGKLGPHAGIAITQRQVLEEYNRDKDNKIRQPVVPKIIHQIFHNWNDPTSKELPEDWARMRQSCIDKNPGWEVKIWFAEDSHAFIAIEYPWFLPTYEGYRFAIQRVDVMRYFLVRKYGGIYIDLDNGCEASLEPLTYYPAFTTDGGLGALSNNIIGGQPEHPWLVMLTDNLPAYAWNWIMPYAIVMYNSGQWYLTAMWERYHRLLRPDGSIPGFEGAHRWASLRRVMMDGREGADPWVFWNHGGHGGTWGAGDDWFWAWLGVHWVEVVAEIVGVVVVLIVGCICCVRCCARWRSRRRKGKKGYQAVTTVADAAGADDVGYVGDDVELQESRRPDT